MTIQIPLVEVFRSVQGEGYHAGRDAVFVRFAGCNLSCVFAEGAVCDTPYQRALLKPTLKELREMVVALRAQRHVDMPVSTRERTMLILTGGEPTLSPHFDEVAHMALDEGFYVAVETNGTRYRPALTVVNWISVSPKETVRQGSPAPYHNHNPGAPKLSDLVLTEMRIRAQSKIRGGEFRYVISADDDAEAYRLPPHDATVRYVSPAIRATGDGNEHLGPFPGFAPGAVERCLEIIRCNPQWRLSLQTHKFLGVR